MLELLSVPPTQPTVEPANAVQIDTVQSVEVAAGQIVSTSTIPTAIAAPESVPPEVAPIPPTTISSDPVSATSVESASSELAYTPAPAGLAPSIADPLASRRQVIEQRLAEIVKRDRQTITTRQQELTALAMQYAAVGQFAQAREIAGNNELAPAAQADLLARVRQLEEEKGEAGGKVEADRVALSTSETRLNLITAADFPYDVEVLAILRAIVTQESSGNYRAVNPHSGALGFAQIMPSNLPSWSREALGREVSRSTFLNSPAIQIQIIAHRLNKYWQSALASSNGDEAIAVRKVASLWYSGKAHLFNSYAPQTYAGKRYPAIAEYTLAVLSRYQREKQRVLG